jgi:hypothetical protein
MKKIITLLLAAGAFVTVNAQTSKDDARKVILGQPKGGTTNGGSTTSKQGRDVILGGGETTGTDRYPGYPTTKTKKKGDCGSKTKSKAKGNNGKHLGWEKGVGNPHRTGAVANKHKNKNKKNRS